jgi:hypothetical protein
MSVTEDSCDAFGEITVPDPFELVIAEEICLVTFDPDEKKNMIVVEYNQEFGGDTIIFFRQDEQSGDYEEIGRTNVNDPGIFIDTIANPDEMSQRYKIAVKNICGIVGQTSLLHRTMLLQSNVGTGGEVNLIWNPYKGFIYDNFEIYRAIENNDFELIATVPFETISFTDVNPPPGLKKYQIRVFPAESCDPYRDSFLYTGSNIQEVLATNVESVKLTGVKVYPNPADQKIYVEANHSETDELILMIYDLKGNEIRKVRHSINQKGLKRFEVDISALAGGVYFYQIISDGYGVYSDKIVIE